MNDAIAAAVPFFPAGGSKALKMLGKSNNVDKIKNSEKVSDAVGKIKKSEKASDATGKQKINKSSESDVHKFDDDFDDLTPDSKQFSSRDKNYRPLRSHKNKEARDIYKQCGLKTKDEFRKAHDNNMTGREMTKKELRENAKEIRQNE
jgi:hypothetical protein